MTSLTTSKPRLHASPSRSRSHPWFYGLGIIAVIALAFIALCQAVLPSIARHRLQSSLERDGTGVHVAIHAFPAVELLTGKADSVTVSIRRLDSSSGHGSLTALLARAAHTARLNATVAQFSSHGLVLDNVSLQKRGSALSLSASVTRTAIQEALPGNIRLLSTQEDPQALSLTIEAALLGHSVSATAHIRAVDGRIEIAPAIPVLELVHFTIFADPQVDVDAIHMTTRGDSYIFDAEGHYT